MSTAPQTTPQDPAADRAVGPLDWFARLAALDAGALMRLATCATPLSAAIQLQAWASDRFCLMTAICSSANAQAWRGFEQAATPPESFVLPD